MEVRPKNPVSSRNWVFNPLLKILQKLTFNGVSFDQGIFRVNNQ
jgi:hypothetical protein